MAINRRLLVWLVKAYFKRWRKQVVIFFFVGLAIFFLIKIFLSTIVAKFPLISKEYIGVVGSYTINTIPRDLLDDVSKGLTTLDPSGTPKPDLATSWEIKDSGKTYVLHLKHNLHFDNGLDFTSDNIKYSFSDVKITRPDKFTLMFHLKEPYAPFLVTLSRPIFLDGFVGVGGNFQIKDIKLNDKFITSLTVTGIKEAFKVKVYQFYPTEEALKLAFVLGSSSKVINLSDIQFNNTSLSKFSNASLQKQTNYEKLVTIFYNTQDSTLSDKRLRDALSYALPNSFPQGEKASSPIPPYSWAYQSNFLRVQDLDHAKILLKAVSDSNSSIPTLTIDSLPEFKSVADTVKNSWKKIGINVNVKVVTRKPDVFQIFLGSFNPPPDPDQYSLWHSDQANNITNYKSLRIDKLLEDGRHTIDQDKRVKIYSDFQKYILDDQPASFLYFPFVYTITRK